MPPYPPGIQRLTVFPISGPTDSSVNPALVDPKGLTFAQNVTYDSAGLARKRYARRNYNSVAVSNFNAVGLGDFSRTGGGSLSSTHKLMCAFHDGTNTDIYKEDADGTWDELQNNWATVAADVAEYTHFLQAQGYIIWSDGASTPRTWDQTSLADLSAGATPFRASAYHRRRLFTAGLSTAPDTVKYTAAGDITDFTGIDAGNFAVGQDDGDVITGLSRPFRGNLYIFKGPVRGSIWVLSGRTPASFQLDQMMAGLGAVNHKCIVTTPNDIFWVSKRGIHSLVATDKFGDTEAAFISAPIQDRFNSSGVAASNLFIPYVWGAWNPNTNEVLFSIPPASGATGEIYKFNVLTRRWSFDASAAVIYSGMTAPVPGTNNIIPFFGVGGGYVLKAEQSGSSLKDSSGASFVAVDCTIKTPVQTMGAPGVVKQFHSGVLYLGPNSDDPVSVSYTIDGTTTGPITVTPPATIAGQLVAVPFPLEGMGRSIRLTIANATSEETLELAGYEILYTWGEQESLANSE